MHPRPRWPRGRDQPNIQLLGNDERPSTITPGVCTAPRPAVTHTHTHTHKGGGWVLEQKRQLQCTYASQPVTCVPNLRTAPCATATAWLAWMHSSGHRYPACSSKTATSSGAGVKAGHRAVTCSGVSTVCGRLCTAAACSVPAHQGRCQLGERVACVASQEKGGGRLGGRREEERGGGWMWGRKVCVCGGGMGSLLSILLRDEPTR